MNTPIQSFVNQFSSRVFEQLFSKKNHEKYSPHLNLKSFLHLFEPIKFSTKGEEAQITTILLQNEDSFEYSFGFENLFQTKGP